MIERPIRRVDRGWLIVDSWCYPRSGKVARRPGAAPGSRGFGDQAAQAGARRTEKSIVESGQLIAAWRDARAEADKKIRNPKSEIRNKFEERVRREIEKRPRGGVFSISPIHTF